MLAEKTAILIVMLGGGSLLMPGSYPSGDYGTWSDGPVAQVMIEDQALYGRPSRIPEPEEEDSIFVSHPAIGRYGRAFYGKSTLVERLEPDPEIYMDKHYFRFHHFSFKSYKILEPSFWTFETQGQILSSPAMSNDGALFFGCNDSSLYSITLYGELNWSYKTGAAVVSSPAIGEDGTIYVGSKDSSLYALSPGGTLQWSRRTAYSILSPPRVTFSGATLRAAR